MRFFIESGALFTNYLTLSKEDLHYLQDVCRLTFSDTLALIVDEKEEVHISKLKFEGHNLYFESVSEKKNCDLPFPLITLVQGLPKQEKFEEILNMCTQIGIQYFIPILMKRTIIKWEESKKREKLQRWKSIVKAAAIQSKRTSIPEVMPILGFEEFIQQFPFHQFDHLIVAWEEEQEVFLADYLYRHCIKADTRKICILIGPEGGIEAKEIRQLKEKSFYSVSIGKTILRTENAGFFTAAQIILAKSLSKLI